MRVLIGILLSSLLLVGCGGGGSDPPPPPAGAIEIINATSSRNIDETYVAPTSSETWGPNRNGETTIPPSYSVIVGALTPGLWNVMAVSHDSYSTYYAHASDLNVLAGQMVPLSFGYGDFSGSLDVTNDSGYYSITITGLYVTPSWSGTWGPNQLSAPLGYTSMFQISNLPPDTYDVLCDFSDGSSSIYRSNSIASFSVRSIYCY
jgi:hypothetical protein